MTKYNVKETLLLTKINDFDNKEIINGFDCGNSVINALLGNYLNNSYEQSVVYLLIKDDKD